MYTANASKQTDAQSDKHRRQIQTHDKSQQRDEIICTEYGHCVEENGNVRGLKEELLDSQKDRLK